MDERRDDPQIQKLFMTVSHAYFVSLFHQLNEIGIHPGQVPLLMLLQRDRELSQKEIAYRLCLSAPTVTMSIRRLEKSDMVGKCQDKKDQRVSRIYLTEKGRECTEQIKKIFDANEKKLVRGFSEAELCLFQRFCRQLRENIKTLERGMEEA